jgi:hypothetical protein
MTALLQAVASAKPREKAGAHTMKRYGFQVHFSILKLLELHKTGDDYRAAFDHFDDLMVFDKADQPEKVDFYQIKSQAKGEWTLSAMTSKDGKTKPATFLGRLHHHMTDFGNMVGRLGFVSNLGFRLKLATGKNTTDDHTIIKSADLHADELTALKAAVANDAVSPPTVVGSHLFVFERTGLGLVEQETFVKGRLVEVINDRGDCDHVGAIALYDALRGNVFTKSSVTQEFTTTSEFYERKTLCRSDIEAIFSKGAARKRFHDNWRIVEGDLLSAGMNSRQRIALHNGCISYINARSSGEPGAVAFSAEIQKALSAYPGEVAACGSVPEIAALLNGWVSSEYEHRAGAVHVEAFEEMV